MEEKIIKRDYEHNFQKYLWNQYDILHDRLIIFIFSNNN